MSARNKTHWPTFLLPTIRVCLHSNFCGGLRKTHLFCNRVHDAYRPFKVVGQRLVSEVTCYVRAGRKTMSSHFQRTICTLLHFTGAEVDTVDTLSFETLIPKNILERYISLLIEHRRLILCGPTGTGKTYLASRLAQHLVRRSVMIGLIHNMSEISGGRAMLAAGHSVLLL